MDIVQEAAASFFRVVEVGSHFSEDQGNCVTTTLIPVTRIHGIFSKIKVVLMLTSVRSSNPIF